MCSEPGSSPSRILPRTTPASSLHDYGTFICQAGGHSEITRNLRAIRRKIRNSSRKLTNGSTARQGWSLITSTMWISSITLLLREKLRFARVDGVDFLRSKNRECGNTSNPRKTKTANHPAFPFTSSPILVIVGTGWLFRLSTGGRCPSEAVPNAVGVLEVANNFSSAVNAGSNRFAHPWKLQGLQNSALVEKP